MDNALLIAILAGLGGMIGWGAADFFAKKTIDDIGPIKSLVWGHAFGTLMLALVSLVSLLTVSQFKIFPSSGSTWLGFMFFGALQMIVYWLLYIGFEKGQLAVLNPVFASFTGLVALISIIFFNEPTNTVILMALALIFIGNIFLNLDIQALKTKKLKVTPGLKEVSLATVLAAIWTLGWDRFVGGHESIAYTFWMYAFMTLSAVLIALLMNISLKGIKPGLWKFLALIGIGEAVAYLAVSWGYSSTSLTSVVALISGAFSIPTIILAYIFLHERLSKLQLASIALIILGIIVVTIE